MKKSRIITARTQLIPAIAILSLCFPAAMGAQGKGNEKGVVASIRDGKLEKMENVNWRELAVGQDVFFGERVRTDKTAVAMVKFPDVGQFVIGPSSEIEMGKDPKNFQTKMDRGALWFKADLPKGGRASVSTSLATAGVRGTAFSVICSEDGGCVCTCSGKVEVALKSGQTIDVSKGKYIPLVSDEPAPKKAPSSAPLLGGKDTRSNADFNRCFNRKKKDTAPGGATGEKKDTGFEFCLHCHLEGGKGKLKQDWK